MEPISHRNRKGQVYYLHMGQTKTGKPKYFFSQNTDGNLVHGIPQGYTVFEHPNGSVHLQRLLPQIITDDEFMEVCRQLECINSIARGQVVRKGAVLTIYATEKSSIRNPNAPSLHDPLERRMQQWKEDHSDMRAEFRFELIDEEQRLFCAYRYCYLGSIDDWIAIGLPGAIGELASKYLKHLGQQSYFDLH